MFLRYNKDRTGYIGGDDMRAMCRSLQLPVDDDVINEVSYLPLNSKQELSPLEKQTKVSKRQIVNWIIDKRKTFANDKYEIKQLC